VGVLASREKPQIMDAHHQCFLRQRIGYFEKLPAPSLFCVDLIVKHQIHTKRRGADIIQPAGRFIAFSFDILSLSQHGLNQLI
jgi:hypothetical protein